MKTIDASHVVALFNHMRLHFGHRWESINGAALGADQKLTASARKWLEELSEYTLDQLGAALKRMKVQKPEWPPGIYEFQSLMENLPTVEQILDRARDYGDVCHEIRCKIDWFNIDGMSSEAARKAVGAKRQQVIESMRSSGEMQAISRDEAAALAPPAAG